MSHLDAAERFGELLRNVSSVVLFAATSMLPPPPPDLYPLRVYSHVMDPGEASAEVFLPLLAD